MFLLVVSADFSGDSHPPYGKTAVIQFSEDLNWAELVSVSLKRILRQHFVLIVGDEFYLHIF